MAIFLQQAIASADLFHSIAAFLCDDLRDFVRLSCTNRGINSLVSANTTLFKHFLFERCIQSNNEGITTSSGENSFEDFFSRLARHDDDVFNIISRFYEKRKCCRSGCLQVFREADFTPCFNHYGRLIGGTWSCCKTKRQHKGCRAFSFHDGSFHDALFSQRQEGSTTSSLPHIRCPLLNPPQEAKPTVLTSLLLPQISKR